MSEKEGFQEKLMEGVAKVLESQNFKEFLLFSSKFRDYSLGNTLLIWAQRSSTTRVAGFKTWLSLGRHVKKGEKGIQIFAPLKFKTRAKTPDGDTGGALEVDKTEEFSSVEDTKKEKSFTRFRAVYVFDVSQTEGAHLPELEVGKPKAEGNVDAGAIFERILRASPVPVGYEDLQEEHKGSYLPDEKRIILNTSLTPTEKCETLLHELAHHFDETGRDEVDLQIGRSTKEVVAEGATYLACASLGIDSSGYSFVYLANWGKEYKKVLAAGDAIRRIGNLLIDLVGAEASQKEENKAA